MSDQLAQAKAEVTINFPCGQLSLRKPSVEVLRQHAIEWLALAELHFAETQALVDAGELETAIQQSTHAESKIAAARVYLIEARELEAMEKGS